MNPTKNTIFCGGNLEVVKSWPPNIVSAIVTDPPYGLGFMGKDWDTLIEKTRDSAGGFLRNGKSGSNPYAAARCRHGSDSLQMQEWYYQWAKAMLRITKPGGFLLCFGGTRTFHRLACAIEDAGWEIRDCMMWLYGQGFPKSHNIGKAIDKVAGAKRKVIGTRPVPGYARSEVEHGKQNRTKYEFEQTSNEASTPLAEVWQGYGTALKPAWEPIIVAMKPLDGTFAHNAEAHGVAGLNIDAARIGTQEDCKRKPSSMEGQNCYGKYNYPIGGQGNSQGRWPANLVLDEEAGAMLDEQIGTCKSGFMAAGTKRQMSDNPNKNTYGKFNPDTVANDTYGDSGGASRFFYCAKCSRRERNMGLDKSVIISIIKEWKENNITKEAKLAEIVVDMATLQKKVISESGTKKKNVSEWNTILFGKNIKEKYQQDLESIIGTTTDSTIKSQILNWLVLLFTKEYTADVNLLKEDGGSPVENVKNCNLLRIIINEKMESLPGAKNVVSITQLKISVKEKTNVHPTVKPLALMKYLCTLLKMPSAEQIILDPFMGSGTTGMACKELGINFIGIEKEREYCEIAIKRIAAVEGQEITLETTLPVTKNVEMFRATKDFAGGSRRPNENLPRISEHRQSIINAASAALRNKRS